MANLFARKPLDRLMHEAQEVGEHSLKRSLGPINLMALGIANRGYILQTGEIVLTDSADKLRQNPAVRKAYLGED